MITLNVYKAEGFKDKPVDSVTITIEREIVSTASLDEARAIYEKEAGALADVLFAALPGGVIDALLIEFLSRKHSLLVIPHPARSQESRS